MSWGENIDDLDPDALEQAIERLSVLFKPDGPYPCDDDGMDAVPDEPSMVVSNHSGGLLIPDVWGLGYVWYRRFGVQRPIHGLGHEVLFKTKATGRPLARLGVLRASRTIAIEALRSWRHDVAVTPGGDVDVFRPYSERFKVRFGGRKGYAKIALRAGAPVVPVANSGAHETLIVLRTGKRIAKALRLHTIARSDVFPITLSFPWGLTVGPVPNLPVPARFRYRFAPAIRLEEGPVPDPTQAQIDELDLRVRTSMQELLDQLADETPTLRQRLRHGLRT